MKAFAETVTALGRPVLLRTIGTNDAPQALVARWKHGAARVETNAEDAVRVILSLRGDGHTVRQGRGFQPPRPIVAGSVSVLAADRSSDVTIEGHADVVQLFIAPACLDEAAGKHVDCVPHFDSHDPELQAAALQLFVGARRGAPDDDLLMETSLWRIIEHLVRSPAADGLKRSSGGLALGAKRRVGELIAERLDDSERRGPSLGELAGAARMSVSHFIRAFKKSTGETPHQHVVARRIERALGLLGRPDGSVAEVADSAGFASPSHFVSSFRRRLGMTPGTYRQAVLE